MNETRPSLFPRGKGGRKLAWAGLVFLQTLAFFLPAARGHEAESLRYTPVVRAVRKVSPAVVNIGTEQVLTQRQNPFYSRRIDPFFERFFGDLFENYPRGRKYKRQSLGSGVIIDSKGYIITNEHVILKASKVTVSLADGREFAGQLIGSDPKTDLAVIKIEDKEDLPAVKMGSSDDLMIGETVIAIGNPFGLSHTVTTGVVSALDRSLKIDNERVYNDFIQTDASINPGNSGGPLLNLEGELIGINTAIYQKAEGIGFAIPINKARRIVEDLIAFGEVHSAWVGVFVQNMTPQLAAYFNLPPGKGVLVSKVLSGSPAEKAGLRQGDVLVKIDGKPIKSRQDYEARLGGFTAGDVIAFGLIRDGEEKEARVKTVSLPLDSADEFARQWLGISVTQITGVKKLLYRLATSQGVLVSEVMPRSPAAEIGLEPGDVVRQINNMPIKGMSDYKKAILAASQKDSVLLLVQRGQYGYYVTLEP